MSDILSYFSGGMEADTNANFLVAQGAQTLDDYYNPTKDIFVTKNVAPTSGSDFIGEIGNMFKYAGSGAIEAAKLPVKAASKVIDAGKSLLMYLAIGLVIVGIVLVFAHGAGTKLGARIAL